MTLKEKIKDYIPCCEQEADKEYVLKWMDVFEDVWTRDNTFALNSASAFVINHNRSKMLVVYHNIYDGFTQVAMQME